MDEDSSRGPAEGELFAGDAWFDPLEAGIRGRIRGLIEELVEQELEAALGRGRYERKGVPAGHRHGHRTRRLAGSFGPVEVAVPRCRGPGCRPRAVATAPPGNGAAPRCPATPVGPASSRR